MALNYRKKTRNTHTATVSPRKHDKPQIAGKPSAQENARRWIVRVIFIVYWLLIFEGVLRKWAFPGLHKFIFFIRDPFVLATYFLAYKYKLWPKWTPIFTTGMCLGLLFIPLGLVQVLMSLVPIRIILYGLRNYFMYLPFTFIVGEQMRGKDLARLIRQTLWVSIPIAVLCYRQFSAPADDIINESYGRSGQDAMIVAEGVVRTSGTFTVSAAQTLYIGSIFAMVLACWLLPPKQRPMRLVGLLVASLAALTCLAVSGARSSLLVVALIAASAVLSLIIIYRKKITLKGLKRVAILPGLMIAGIIGLLKLFPRSVQLMMERQELAGPQEGGTMSRILSFFTSYLAVWPKLTLMGLGIGAGTNAAAAMMIGSANFLMGEDEWSRIVLEAGVFGLLYLLYRTWLTAWLFIEAIKAVDRSHNPLPLLFFGFIW